MSAFRYSFGREREKEKDRKEEKKKEKKTKKEIGRPVDDMPAGKPDRQVTYRDRKEIDIDRETDEKKRQKQR